MAEITEIKTIKIDHECKANPVCLCWLNSLGGYSFWVFSAEHSITTSTSINSLYKNNVPDLETAIGTENIIGKDVLNTLNIGSRVLDEDMDGMQGLYTSTAVYRLTNNDSWSVDGAKWQRVIIKKGSLLTLKTDTTYKDVRMSLMLPLSNRQQQ